MNVQHIRKRRMKMTQVAFAEMLDVSQQLVSDWETGRKDLSVRDKAAIKWFLNKSACPPKGGA